MGASLDCLRCGACCAPAEDWPAYVEVTRIDAMRLPAEMQGQVQDGELMTVRRPGGIRCVALEGELGVCVSCRIHPLRPDACRRFEQGSDECHAARLEILGIVAEP